EVLAACRAARLRKNRQRRADRSQGRKHQRHQVCPSLGQVPFAWRHARNQSHVRANPSCTRVCGLKPSRRRILLLSQKVIGGSLGGVGTSRVFSVRPDNSSSTSINSRREIGAPTPRFITS